jgi:hypothetical protein
MALFRRDQERTKLIRSCLARLWGRGSAFPDAGLPAI